MHRVVVILGIRRIDGQQRERPPVLPTFRASRLNGLGLEVIGGAPEAFVAEMKRDFAWASRTIKAAGIKAE